MSRIGELYEQMQCLCKDIFEAEQEAVIGCLPISVAHAIVEARFKRLVRTARSFGYNIYYDKLPFNPELIDVRVYEIMCEFNLFD